MTLITILADNRYGKEIDSRGHQEDDRENEEF